MRATARRIRESIDFREAAHLLIWAQYRFHSVFLMIEVLDHLPQTRPFVPPVADGALDPRGEPDLVVEFAAVDNDAGRSG